MKRKVARSPQLKWHDGWLRSRPGPEYAYGNAYACGKELHKRIVIPKREKLFWLELANTQWRDASGVPVKVGRVGH